MHCEVRLLSDTVLYYDYEIEYSLLRLMKCYDYNS